MSQQNPFYHENDIELEDRVQVLRNGAEELLAIMREKFGETDVRTSRAGEICDTLQRLRWELERQPHSASA